MAARCQLLYSCCLCTLHVCPWTRLCWLFFDLWLLCGGAMSAQPYPDLCAFGTSDPALSITDGQGIPTTNASIAPTKQEQEAIVLLKDQDAAIVCAYLRVARALGGGSQFNDGQSVLTKDKVHAIFALSGHQDATVWSWLANAQGASMYGLLYCFRVLRKG